MQPTVTLPIVLTMTLLGASAWAGSSAREAQNIEARQEVDTLEKAQSESIQKITLPPSERKTKANTEPKLISAVARGNHEEVRSLIQAKTELNVRDEDGGTALLYAVSNGDLEMVRILVEAGADLSLVYGKKKENILFEACQLGGEEIVRLLIRRDSELVHQKNTDQETPLFEAARNGHPEVVSILLQAGAQKQIKNSSGETPYQLALKRKLRKTAELLK